MKWNKIINATLATGIALGIGACSSSTTATSSTAETEDTTKETQTLIIATSPDYPPYENLENGEMVGFDMDMVDWLFNWLNENGYNYDYEWKQMSFDTIVTAIQGDQVDLGVAGFVYNESRAENASFSNPYYESGQVVLLNADSDISSVEDLVGKNIGAQSGTTGEECAKEIEGATLTSIQDATILVETLKAGSIDAVILEKPVAENYAANGDYKVLDEMLKEEQNYILTAKEGKEDLLEAMNKAIAAFKESDEYATLVAKWFE